MTSSKKWHKIWTISLFSQYVRTVVAGGNEGQLQQWERRSCIQHLIFVIVGSGEGEGGEWKERIFDLTQSRKAAKGVLAWWRGWKVGIFSLSYSRQLFSF